MTLLAGFVEHVLGLSATKVGMLYGVSATGGLIASVLINAYADSALAQRLYRAGAFLFGTALLLSSCCRSLLTASLAFFLVGATSGVFATLYSAILVRTSAPRFLGRVIAIGSISVGAYGIMGLPFGLAADAFGEPAVLAGMGITIMTVVVLFGRRGEENAGQP